MEGECFAIVHHPGVIQFCGLSFCLFYERANTHLGSIGISGSTFFNFFYINLARGLVPESWVLHVAARVSICITYNYLSSSFEVYNLFFVLTSH